MGHAPGFLVNCSFSTRHASVANDSVLFSGPVDQVDVVLLGHLVIRCSNVAVSVSMIV